MRWVIGCLAFLVLANADVIAQEKLWMAIMVNDKKVGYYKKARVVQADTVVTTELTTYTIDGGTNKIDLLAVTETVETVETATRKSAEICGNRPSQSATDH